MTQATSPTNAQIVEMLDAIQRELRELRQQQQRLSDDVAKLTASR